MKFLHKNNHNQIFISQFILLISVSKWVINYWNIFTKLRIYNFVLPFRYKQRSFVYFTNLQNISCKKKVSHSITHISKAGGGNLVLRHSIPRFPSNLYDIQKWVAELNAAFFSYINNNCKKNIKKKYWFPIPKPSRFITIRHCVTKAYFSIYNTKKNFLISTIHLSYIGYET